MSGKEQRVEFCDGVSLTTLASAVADAGFIISGTGRKKIKGKWSDIIFAETPHNLSYHIPVLFSVHVGKKSILYSFETEEKTGKHLTARMMTHHAWKAVHELMDEQKMVHSA